MNILDVLKELFKDEEFKKDWSEFLKWNAVQTEPDTDMEIYLLKMYAKEYLQKRLDMMN